jgi:hypothetical protein
MAEYHGLHCKIIDGAGCHQLNPAKIEYEEETGMRLV